MKSTDHTLPLDRLQCSQCRSASLTVDAKDLHTATVLCGDCGATMKLEEGVLNALAEDLEEGVSSNLAFYEKEAATGEKNVLAKRSGSRNHRTKQRKILTTIGENPPLGADRLLELGTGLGDHAAAYVRAGWNYHGIDISPGFLRIARRHYPELQNQTLVAANAEKLPFQDSSMDAVVCVATLHHLPEPGKGMSEIFRLLRPGGKFCFLEPRRYYPSNILAYLRCPEAEISVMKMCQSNFRRWLAACDITDYRFEPLIFTPNRPRVAGRIYDAIDRTLLATGPMSFLSVMFSISGTKRD